ncbi:MAG: putative lipid II flippase FtsW [Candidatus Omnitrophica bacterium]|nr:putative lipid II flippase FtsW [Candidatus Omnitrophota bacterium]
MRSLRRSIFIITLILIAVGIVMIYSSSGIYAHEKYGSSFFFLKRHLLFCAIGVLSMLFVMLIDIGRIERHTKIFLLIAVTLLIGVLMPGLGIVAGGARRWFRIGGLSFQPSEFAKLALIVYLASFFSRKGDRIKDLFLGYLPCMAAVACLSFLVILQPDLGTAVAVFFVGFLIIFIGGGKLKHLINTLLIGTPFLYYIIFSAPYRKKRILIFLNPWCDREGSGFQIIQSFLALGSGGLFGVGLGQSKQKLFYLPASHTDFIFSIIGEELGFIGAAFVVVLFGMLFWQGMRAFLREHRPFNRIIIFGVTCMIAFEALVNIGVSIGAFPTKGLPLPFISYGGSSLIFHMTAIGLMLNAMKE